MFKKYKSFVVAALLAGTFLRVTGTCQADVQRLPFVPAYLLDEMRSVTKGAHYAFAVNNHGQTTGSSGTGHAYLYQSGHSRDLGTLFGGRYSMCFGLNDKGEITGESDTAITNGTDTRYQTHAFFTYPDGVMIDLGKLPDSDWSRGLGINNKSEIVGQSGGHAFLYRNGRMVDMNNLIDAASGWTLEVASGINDAGQIVGTGHKNNGYWHGFLYSQGKVIDLGTLPSALTSIGGNRYNGGGINSEGSVTGQSEAIGNDGVVRDHAVLYKNKQWARVEMTTLTSCVFSLNDVGQAVGSFQSSQRGNSHAFLFTNDHFVDLNTVIPLHSGWRLESAYGINNRGQIVGEGMMNGQRKAYLLTPNPKAGQPAT